MKTLRRIKTALLSAACALGCARASAQEWPWLDKVDEKLQLSLFNGFVRSDLSGLLDLEGYYIDQNPPGLIYENKDFLFNPRLSLFLDTQIGKHLYSGFQVRFDRGFDPGSKLHGDARFDEYFLRYTPFDDPRINLQFGKFATVIGNWVPRHDSWHNPFINAPLPYDNVIVMGDYKAPLTRTEFLGRKSRMENVAQKSLWIPVIWGPSYATGGSVFGVVDRFEYAFEVKNTSLSSRPYVWDPMEQDFGQPTFSGRLGYRPNAMWKVGANASVGPYMQEEALQLPPGKSPGDFNQIVVGPDVSFEWHHWQLWGEAYASRFEVPVVGNADTVAYYVEAKYKFDEHWFTGLRWNQQLFDKVSNGTGGSERWDRDMWRAEAALGYRHNRHLQTKVQYSYSRQNGPFQQGEQLVAGQITLKF